MANFNRESYFIAQHLVLQPLEQDQCQQAGEMLASISPWVNISYPAKLLTGYLSLEDPAAYKYAVLFRGELAGVICVRFPWLKGPYLELLGLFPAFQNSGIGTSIMKWFEECGRQGSRNLWLVASDFNGDAIRFYQRHGFEELSLLEDLSENGVHDVLMRKALF